jgi:signal transduction histidine kinase
LAHWEIQGLDMTALEKLQLVFKQYRKDLNEGQTPADGFWGRTTKTPVITWVVVVGTFLFVMAANGDLFDLEILWVLSVGMLTYLATLFPAVFLAWRLEKTFEPGANGFSFFKWALGSTLMGILAGHAALIGLTAIHPKGLILNNLNFLNFIPVVSIVFGIGYSTWRFLYVREWQYKLDTERLKREAAEHGQALAQAQLKMLQAQIEPHFLFNTLASIQHLVRKDPQLADFLLSQLISYLRQAVPDIRGVGSTLGREFGLIESYLNIAKIRMGGRLEVEVNLPSVLADVSFPVLIIHTLVENALKHGVEPKPGGVKISVLAQEVLKDDQKFIEIMITDNGVGFGGAKTQGTGVGLSNVRERLAALYGDNARLTVSNAEPSGVCATVRFPRI